MIFLAIPTEKLTMQTALGTQILTGVINVTDYLFIIEVPHLFAIFPPSSCLLQLLLLAVCELRGRSWLAHCSALRSVVIGPEPKICRA